MGTAELDRINHQLLIRSHIITYGAAADEELTELIRAEIESMWNEPQGSVLIDEVRFNLHFQISADYRKHIEPVEILANTEPRNNYFRIEEFVAGNISFVDGIGCNTGFFKKENLYNGSTTAAHEYGHTIGLTHPHFLDLRGQGVPGIMYPRGTLVDPMYQYNPAAKAGDSNNGGTMHPMHRRVLLHDISLLKLERLDFVEDVSLLGDFSSVWHPPHDEWV